MRGRQVSSHPAELGFHSDAGGLAQLGLGLDTALGSELALFSAALLGTDVDDASLSTPAAKCPRCGGGKRTAMTR